MNAHLKNTEVSAIEQCDCNLGTLPLRLHTVRAAVLASTLESNVLTGMDSVFKQNTTRLSAVIYALEHEYGWHFERRDVATGTSDGRVATIVAYWLPQATIAKAFEAGARSWIDGVNAARAECRKKSAKCKAQADRVNAARKLRKPDDPRQGNFWGNV